MKNLIDGKFGKLVVLSREPNYLYGKYSKTMWLCGCECGNLTATSSDRLLANRVKSCGCLKNKIRLPGDEASFNSFYSSYKQNASHTGKTFLLDKDEFRKLSQQSCHYCGSNPKPYYAPNRTAQPVPFVCNGIDRVDNSGGYEVSNCVSCCSICNFMKQGLSSIEFLAQIKKIYQFGVN